MRLIIPSVAGGLVLAVLLAGCAHTRRAAPPATATLPATVVLSDPPEPAPSLGSVARPAAYKAYFLGRIVDPQHPELMHGAGVVFRRELPETWDTGSGSTSTGAVASGPIRSLRHSAELTEQTAADAEIFQARTSQLVDALLAQNQELVDKLAALVNSEPAGGVPPTVAAPRQQDWPARPEADRRPQVRADEPTITLAPSSENIIELTPALLDPPATGLTNPFRQRYQFNTPLQELQISITGLSLGPEPSCVIGDRIYNIGDAFESFAIESITAEGVFLRKGAFLLQIPMQETPITLRYP